MENKISISPYSKIKVQWSDRPENYSKEGKNKIKNHFAKKYGLNENNIDVIYNPVKFNESIVNEVFPPVFDGIELTTVKPLNLLKGT